MTRKHAIKEPVAPNPFEAFKLAVYRFGVAELAAELGVMFQLDLTEPGQ